MAHHQIQHTQFAKWEDSYQDPNYSKYQNNVYSLYVSNLPSSINAKDLKKVFNKV